MQIACSGVPDMLIRLMTVLACWKQLDELSKCFVLPSFFGIDFCVATLKEATTILTLAEQYLQTYMETKKDYVAKATFVR